MTATATKEKVNRTPFTSERRKKWKKDAKHMLKTHYVLLVLVVLLAGLLGVESGYNPNRYELNQGESMIKIVNEDKARETGYGAEVDRQASAAETARNEQAKILEDLMMGEIDAGVEDSSKKIEEYRNAAPTGEILGRRGGILAGIVNDVTTGSVLARTAQAIRSIVRNGKLAGAIVIILMLGVYFLVWFVLINPFKVTESRVFLEARTYAKVPVGHLLFLRSVRKWKKVAGAMFRYWLYLTLWMLTIVGGIIKHYSYWCVPYILAENPDMTGKEAIALSRKMMYGKKWETFKYDVTFFGWDLLSILTLGILTMVFVTPYKRCADAHLYEYIRSDAQNERIEGIENLKDMFLYEKADPEVLEIRYGDILYRKSLAKSAEVKLTGFRYFCTKYLGIWVGSREEQLTYELVDFEEFNIERAEEAAKALAYPERYNPLWNAESEDKTVSRNNYLKSYTIWSLICMFAIFAFVGWAWEVGIHIIKDGVFINRGVNHGPWLPIYGSGAVLILTVLNRLRKNPAVLAGSTVVLCGLVEYFTSYFMEMKNGIRWWDYTGYFLNLNGRICAEGLTVFAVAGTAAVYVLAPALDRMLQRVNPKILITFCLVFSAAFTFDVVYSHKHPNVGEGITDYNNYQQVEETGSVETDVRS